MTRTVPSSPTDWHLLPDVSSPRCEICGCAAKHLGNPAGRGKTQHRATSPDCTAWESRRRSACFWKVKAIGTPQPPTAGPAACQATGDGPAESREVQPQAHPKRPSEATVATVRGIVAICATSGSSMADACRAFGLSPRQLRRLRENHPALWESETAAVTRLEVKRVPDGVREAMPKAAAMMAAGYGHEEITAELGLKKTTVNTWQEDYAEQWKVELDRAMSISLGLVRQLAGTAAVLSDPAAFVRQAQAVARWVSARGETLFPEPKAATLTTFFDTFYKPTRLTDADKSTIKQYGETLKKWQLLTGDPPLEKITAQTLAAFRDALGKLRGQRPVERMTARSVAKHMAHVQFVLDRAGPPGPKLRDAAGILPHVPYCKPPRYEERLVKIVPIEHLERCHTAAVGMDAPRLPGIKAPAWWRALLSVAFFTGLRRRTLFALKMSDIDWKGQRLMIPAKRMKGGRPHPIHLNPDAMRHLLAIRTDRERVFEWPHTEPWFYRHFHRLQDLAGIPRSEQFGLHAVRKTVATELWRKSPAAAQLAMGHTAASVTMKYYVQSEGIVADALDQLPQPWASAQAGK